MTIFRSLLETSRWLRCMRRPTNRPKRPDTIERVNYLYPLSDSGTRAAKSLDALKTQMGPLSAARAAKRLERANRFLVARQYTKARIEFAVLREELNGGTGMPPPWESERPIIWTRGRSRLVLTCVASKSPAARPTRKSCFT